MDRHEALKAIEEYRRQIDEIDRRIVDILNERTRIVVQLGELKEQLALPIYEPQREDEIYRNVIRHNRGPLPPEALRRLFERILDEMRTLQKIHRENRDKRPQPAAGMGSQPEQGRI